MILGSPEEFDFRHRTLPKGAALLGFLARRIGEIPVHLIGRVGDAHRPHRGVTCSQAKAFENVEVNESVDLVYLADLHVVFADIEAGKAVSASQAEVTLDEVAAD